MLKPGTTDSQAAAMRLSRKYGFRLMWVLRAAGKGFIAPLLTPSEIAKLRCEPDVEVVSYDRKTSITGS
jgi:hypothetical protein